MNIITHARANVNQKHSKEHYTESHHIIPESIGGDNSPENKVRLTAKQHFICHLLLIKMLVGNDMYKMIHAATAMMFYKSKNHKDGRNFKINSVIYEALKKQKAIAVSITRTGYKNSIESLQRMSEAHAGVPLTQAHKDALSKALKGRPGPTKGIPLTEEHKAKLRFYRHTDETKAKMRESRPDHLTQSHKDNISKALRGRRPSQACLDAVSIANRGRKPSKETITKQNAHKLGKLWIWNPISEEHLLVTPEEKNLKMSEGWSEGRKGGWKHKTKRKTRSFTQAKVTCPKCGETGGKSNMVRFHFDNCKPKIPKNRNIQAKATCPHCGLTGGKNNMTTYHFDNCKYKFNCCN